MKKIPTLFKRTEVRTEPWLCIDKVNPKCQWVLDGEGRASEKFDGTACMVTEDNMWYKRYDRKPNKQAHRAHKKNPDQPYEVEDFRDAPTGWIPCEDKPNIHTGHWPGWMPISNKDPNCKWHIQAIVREGDLLTPGTYELCGPHFQDNPHGLPEDEFLPHGMEPFKYEPRDFHGLKEFLLKHKPMEGLVFAHPDGRMCKIKRGDFGLPWPVKES